jgi:hypothetical protein
MVDLTAGAVKARTLHSILAAAIGRPGAGGNQWPSTPAMINVPRAATPLVAAVIPPVAEGIRGAPGPIPREAVGRTRPRRPINDETQAMKSASPVNLGRLAAGLLLAAAMLAGGCTSVDRHVATTTAPAQVAGKPAQDQPVFDSADALAQALIVAVRAQDHDQVHHLLGPAWKELVSGDKAASARAFKTFAARAAERVQVKKQDDSTSILYVGNDAWSFPIPIARAADGKWFLDTETGRQTVLARRIGRDELEAIQVCRLYVQAQREYANADRDGSDLPKYAQRIISTPGKTDGIYWAAAPGGEASPFGRLLAQAKLEDYNPTPGTPGSPGPAAQRTPYHGYRFRVLKQQSSSAPGGRYPYVIHGNMVAGFALVAFPAEYEKSGIMTFIVGQRGKVYQKDLGPDTTELARHMTEYDPDPSWTLVKD